MIGIIATRAPQLFEISVICRVQECYIWDHFPCRETFVQKFFQENMNWILQRSTHPGKKVPDGATYILTDIFFCLVHTISENRVTIELCVNTDQALVTYDAGASETYAPKSSKQVEVVGKDEKWGFALVVCQGGLQLKAP